MSMNDAHRSPAHPCKEVRATGTAAGREAGHFDSTDSTDKDVATFDLAHSTIVLEDGPAGPVARIERSGRTEYAGPLPEETVDALREVSAGA